MTTSYGEAWAPANLAQAEYLIDTAHAGAAFWEAGRAEAYRIAKYMPQGARRVVDYGCGVGRIIAHMQGGARIGIDVSEGMLRLAKERVRGVVFSPTNGHGTLPLPMDWADFIYSVLTLQHMDAADVAAALRDMRRVLAPGGRVYLAFSGFGEPWSPDKTLGRGPLHWPNETRDGADSPAHGTIAYTPAIIRALAADANLTVLDVLTDQREQLDYVLIGGRS